MDNNPLFMVIVATRYYEPCKDKFHGDYQELVDQIESIMVDLYHSGLKLDYIAEDVINILGILYGNKVIDIKRIK